VRVGCALDRGDRMRVCRSVRIQYRQHVITACSTWVSKQSKCTIQNVGPPRLHDPVKRAAEADGAAHHGGVQDPSGGAQGVHRPARLLHVARTTFSPARSAAAARSVRCPRRSWRRRRDRSSRCTRRPRARPLHSPYTDQHRFLYDSIFDEHVGNREVYRATAAPLITRLVEKGQTSSCFAYGATGAGKVPRRDTSAAHRLPPRSTAHRTLAARALLATTASLARARSVGATALGDAPAH
jgi:hypothetical protein